MVVAVDTNVLLDILEQRVFPASLALTADWVTEAAELAVTPQSRSDFAVGVAGVEQVPQPDAAGVGGLLGRGHQQFAGPIQGVVLAAAVAEGPLLHSAADLVEGGVAQPHHMERVRDLGRVGQRGVEGRAVGA